jgi:hypothetical protein
VKVRWCNFKWTFANQVFSHCTYYHVNDYPHGHVPSLRLPTPLLQRITARQTFLISWFWRLEV